MSCDSSILDLVACDSSILDLVAVVGVFSMFQPGSGDSRKVKKSVSADALGTTNASAVSSITNYSTLMMETRKNANMYTLVSTHLNALKHVHAGNYTAERT